MAFEPCNYMQFARRNHMFYFEEVETWTEIWSMENAEKEDA
jgi:hypothetical protein